MNNPVPSRDLFDENWYLATNPDVAESVLRGSITSALAHYEMYGKREGRSPRAAPGTFDRIYTYGSFGSNNVGDEAILDGLRVFYPEAIQLFHNKARDDSPAVQFGAALRAQKTFGPRDYLIIGGGGLLYDRETVQIMVDLAKKATAAGARVDILRLGCEAADSSYHDVIRELFSLARFASVRSRASQDIIERIVGRRPVFQKDFAFELNSKIAPATGSGGPIPTFGVALSTTGHDELVNFADALRPYIKIKSSTQARFILIPHSRSYFNASNNDIITGEILFCNLCISPEYNEYYSISPFTSDPLTALQKYRQLDGVISSRYHGLIFSQLVGIPSVAMYGESLKITSVMDDNPAPGRFTARNAGDLPINIERLYKYAMLRRAEAGPFQ